MQYSARFLLAALALLSPAYLLARTVAVTASPVIAQTTSFELPETVPTGTSLSVQSSPNMGISTRALKDQFEASYAGTEVNVEETSSDEAIQALLAGDVDLAAIGRPLTDEELEQGLVTVPLAREKIAIFVGADNPFEGNLTFEQFAGMFRGEITDWSQVGGQPGPIRFVDRPDNSDIRRALSQYEVFQQAPFEPGDTVDAVTQDDTAVVIQELGEDGIGYAIAPEVLEQRGVKIVAMHETLPDDPRYPYSQPRYLVYQETPSPAVAAFLGYATSSQGATALAEARQAEATEVATALGAAPAATIATEATTDGTATESSGSAGDAGATDSASSADSATTDVPAGSEGVTGTATEAEVVGETATTNTVTTDDEQGGAGWLWWLLPLAGLGALGWWALGRGNKAAAPVEDAPVITAAVPPTESAATTAAVDEPLSVPEPALEEVPEVVPPPVVPAPDVAAASVPEAANASIDDMPPEPTPVYEENGAMPTVMPVPPVVAESSLEGDTDVPPAVEEPAFSPPVVPEVAGQGVSARANEEVRPASPPMPRVADIATTAAGVGGLAASAAAAVAGTEDQSAIEASKYNVVGRPTDGDINLSDIDDGLPPLPDGYGESRIVLMARDPQWAYAYWDTPHTHKEALRQQGGERLALRLYDVTDIDLNHQAPHGMQQFDCDELAREWYLQLPISDRDYMVEIGYLTGDGRWLLLAQSNTVRIPPVYPSDWQEEHFMTVGWEESLKGKTLITLVDPRLQVAGESSLHEQMYSLSQMAELQRVSGSIFGSMQHVPGSVVPQQSVSSYIFPSGVGMGFVPTMSGLTMSGVGFSASAPPIRPRKFWLVADAELIVYGATEPDASVTIGGNPIQLTPDGTFRFQTSFQDGTIEYPIMAVAADGEQSRWIHMTFERQTPERRTNTRDEAQEEWPES
jgi:ABC-type phosphate transport system substrate-binding protein